MPVTGPTVASALVAAAPELVGPDWLRLSTVLGNAIAAWAVVPANVVLNGVTTGVAGSGTVNGTVSVAPNVPLVAGALTSAGFAGPNSASLAKAVAVGVATSFTASALYQGASVGVGSGSDVSTITAANPVALSGIIQATASAAGMNGPNIAQLSVGVGNGVAALLLTGTGVGVVAGPGGPVPGAGTSVSRVV